MDCGNNNRWRWMICLLLAGVTLGVFWRVTTHDFISWDDPDYVTTNSHVLTGLNWDNVVWAFRTGHAANWHPLTWVSHMTDVSLFGLNPGKHHLTNLVLHALNTVLLFLLLGRMTGTTWRSAFVAALFAVHPLHVESVAWVAERKDLLSGFFFMLTLMAYASYVQRSAGEEKTVVSHQSPVGGGKKSEGAGNTVVSHQSSVSAGQKAGKDSGVIDLNARKGSYWFYSLALLAFACGLMSKPMLVTLPCVLLLLDFWPLQRFKLHVKGFSLRPLLPFLWEKAPFFGLSIASSIMTVLVQEKGGAMSGMSGLTFGERSANAVLAYGRYLAKTMWPTDLSIFYPHPVMVRSVTGHWPVAEISVAAFVIAGLAVLAIVRREKQPYIFSGWFWFLGMLVPVIGLVQVGAQAMADRYTYLPLIGLFVCLTWQAWDLAVGSAVGRKVAALLAIAIVAGCTWQTWQQVTHWQNEFTIFEHSLAVTPYNAPAHYNLGASYGKKGQHEAAVEHFRAAAKADPFYAFAPHGAGVSLAALGKWDEAIEAFRAAAVIDGRSFMIRQSLAAALLRAGRDEEALSEYQFVMTLDPSYAEGRNFLGVLLLRRGDPAGAAAQFEAAAQIRPDYAEPLLGLGQALAMQGKFSEAVEQFEPLTKRFPNDPQLLVNLGTAHVELGNTNAASACFKRALELEPGLANENLQAGKELANRGETTMAMARFVTAARLAPGNAQVQEQLGIAHARLGDAEKALAHFQKALALQPDAQAHYNVALAQAMRGNNRDAITHYQEAIRSKPGWGEALNNLAWILATANDSALRNGTEAVRLAEEACRVTSPGRAVFFGTLAAAYAEAQRFAEATATAEKAIQKAQDSGETSLVKANQELLELYRAGRAYHEAPDKR